MLRVLQEREFTPVGATAPIACDVRLVAATNRNLEQMIKMGAFREDLFYRICQVKVIIPPLRDRPEDIPVLAERFMGEAAKGRELKIHPSLMRQLMRYPWAGNVRELMSLMQVACAMVEGDVLGPEALPETSAFARYFIEPKAQVPGDMAAEKSFAPPAQVVSSTPIDERNIYDPERSWRAYEHLIIAKAFRVYGGNATATAAGLGLSLATLYKRIKEWHLKDTTQSIYREKFSYAEGTTLETYAVRIFKAALQHFDARPMQAIAALEVSQGYFYKMVKKK